MIHEVDAIYDHGAFRPLTPLSLAEGARVHLRVEASNEAVPTTTGEPPDHARILSPRLARPEQAADFKMEVIEAADASV
jgi:predicted DNA-binding antitoxin AbrB/MazE fold protein